MSLRTCTVSYCDLKGVEHAIEVTADSLYEAVAQGLRVFRENDWIDEVGRAARQRFRLSSDSPRFSTKFAFRTSNGGWSRKGGRLPR
jgi:hypothetical protein